ncbi:MAG: GNAT family N-acetyltransferase [Candidatus Sumerlaeaceae bacterium]
MYRVIPVSWNSAEADAARAIRMDVFVGEQNVPAEMELDEIDPTAFHVIGYSDSGLACGTGRLFAEVGEAGAGHIGRMAVAPHARGTGCGSAILLSLLEEARRRGYHRAILTAQTHAVAFYEKHGFAAYDDEFLDAGIPHRWMERRL